LISTPTITDYREALTAIGTNPACTTLGPFFADNSTPNKREDATMFIEPGGFVYEVRDLASEVMHLR